MNEQSGTIFSIAEENAWVEGCTISKSVSNENGFYISHFSLAEGTDISAETYTYPKLWMVSEGKMSIIEDGCEEKEISKGEIFITPINRAVGVATKNGCVYTSFTKSIFITLPS